MKTKTKWVIAFCVIVFLAFMGSIWHNDYRVNTHEAIEVETPEGISDEIRG